MTVLYMQQLSGRSGDYGKVLEHTREIPFLAHSDNRYETDFALLNYGWSHNILPIPFVSTIEGVIPLVRLLCRKISISQDKKSPLHYVLTAHYSSEPVGQSQNQEPNPLDKPVSIKWKTNKYNKAIYKDIDGNAILNSAGEYFDPPPEIEYFRWTCNVTKNVADVPSYIIDVGEGGPINESEFTIQGLSVPEQVARITDMDISEVQYAQVNDEVIQYFTFAYAMEFRKEDWKLRLLDQGTRQLDPDDDTKRIAIKDDSTPPKEVKKPWPLDGEGGRLDDPKPDNAIELDFDVIFPFDFSVLPGINE